ncbi:MAG TPA: cytoplasmic protein [Thermoanaerobaculia bacterium]
MKKLALVIGLLVLSSQAAFAQDPLVVNAKTVRLKFENARVRVLEATLNPGDKENLHSHPSYVLYVIEGGKVRNHTADGKVSESEFKAGDVIYRDPLTHWAENIGTTTIHLILVELKEK